MFVADVTVLDCAVLDPIRGLVGQSWHVDAELIGRLDGESVVFDFSYAKKAVKKAIDEVSDHRLVLPRAVAAQASLEIAEDPGTRVSFSYEFGGGERLDYTCPRQALCVLDQPVVTAQALQAYLERAVMKVMPANVSGVRLALREEVFADGQPRYHYTHGLKQHYGNCQRLFHGHRNKLDLIVGGVKDGELENRVAQEWADAHFTYPENVLERDLKIGARQDHLPRLRIRYRGNQGPFEAVLPGRCVYVMPYETTVENISRHLAAKARDLLGRRRASVRARAYEGIGKGAEAAG